MNIYTDGSIKDQFNKLDLEIFGEINCITGELTEKKFRIMNGSSDMTVGVKSLNYELYERLKYKLRTHLENISKDDGA